MVTHVHSPLLALRPSLAGTSAGPAHATIVCELTCESVLWVWKTAFPCSHPPLLALRMSLPPPLHDSLRPEGRALMKTSHLRWSFPKSLILCTLSSVSLCVNCHLLHEASLMMSEQSTDLWVQWNVVRSLFIAMFL